jgi:hypothetical protein
MESILSDRGVSATEYVLAALPVAALLLVFLLAYFGIAGRYNAPSACPLGTYRRSGPWAGVR